MKAALARAYKKSRAIVSSRWLFGVACLLLLVQAGYLALTMSYPMPFDEYNHVGVIDIYAEQYSPFITEQPPHASIHGDITRTNDYLYHYLMSFPWRLSDPFLGPQGQIIFLRFINIFLMIAALWLFWKILQRWGMSRLAANIAALLFVATPVVILLAAHVNYDNALLPLSAGLLWFATNVITRKKLYAQDAIALLSIVMVGAITKGNFLPIAGVVVIFLSVIVVRRGIKASWKHAQKSFTGLKKGTRLALILLLSVSAILFIERFVQNAIVYRSYRIDCAKVQPIEVCKDYSPWVRGYNRQLESDEWVPTVQSAYWFTQRHFLGTLNQGYYSTFGQAPSRYNPEKPQEPFGPYEGRGWAKRTWYMGTVLTTFGVVLVAATLFFVRNKTALYWLAFFVTFGLLFAVWYNTYGIYLKNGGRAYAIQARYTLPVLLPAMYLVWFGMQRILRGRLRYGKIVVGVFVVLYLSGGGIISFAYNSPSYWKWPSVQPGQPYCGLNQYLCLKDIER